MAEVRTVQTRTRRRRLAGPASPSGSRDSTETFAGPTRMHMASNWPTRGKVVARARELLAGLHGEPKQLPELVDLSDELAELIWEAADAWQSEDERKHRRLLAQMMDDQVGQVFSTLLADRAYRSRDPARLVDESRYLLGALGVPRHLSTVEKLQVLALWAVGPALPGAASRGVRQTLRDKTRTVVLSAREPDLSEHLRQRFEQGVHVNVNRLGEAVLGEAAAQQHVVRYRELLERPDVEAISVKVSTLTSQLRDLAWETTLERLQLRLSELYRAAKRNRFRRPDGRLVAKLVNLDMEAYRDLGLTLELFCSVLEQPEFRDLTAGIVLQAYLPDSFPIQRELTAWARARLAAGGAPIRLRIVKGANLEAERVESSLRGWPLPVYPSKEAVDGNMKRMVAWGCQPANARAVHLGIASHNVFDLSFGMVLRAWQGVEREVSFELLEGMAEPLLRTVREVADNVLVYAPVADDRAMHTAIAYLIRRLNENTGEQNFLRHSFGLRPGGSEWLAQRQRFLSSCRHGWSESTERVRRQDRRQPPSVDEAIDFRNEPDTDFALPHNRDWIRDQLERGKRVAPVPLEIGGEQRWCSPMSVGFDPSRPGCAAYAYAVATAGDLEDALHGARQTLESWSRVEVSDRFAMLGRVADGMRAARGELIAATVLDAGKRVEEADAEVSEAIDLVELYRRQAVDLHADASVQVVPKGVVLVTPPWNFPLAIPTGGVVAALAAGNVVILKPAPETPLVAHRLVELCYAAQVPRGALQFVVCTDELGSTLVRDPRVSAVVLTGGMATVRLFQQLRPNLDLVAESGGKNAIVVSAMADRDLAIKTAILSAFGHAGQKCSAASLLICESEVYDDPGFRESLRDAAASLPVGSAWDPDSIVTPLIRPPIGALARGLQQLEPGESWLLEPQVDPHNDRLCSPGIKLGVREGSFTHLTELFGPVLGVMRADNLDHALRLANATPYGLTAGLQSLDEREQVTFTDRMRAGNLYVNRGVTGAIVRRQPFGGTKASCVGPGAKAGGPNYVAQLTRLADGAAPAESSPPAPAVEVLLERVWPHLDPAAKLDLRRAIASYAWALEHYFRVGHDPSQVRGQANVFRYRLPEWLLVRISEGATGRDAALVCAAALTCSEALELSVSPAARARLPWIGGLPGVRLRVERAAAVAARLRRLSGPGPTPQERPIERIRAVGDLEAEVLASARQLGIHVADQRPLCSGRWELLRYLWEQSVSIDYHRYGNLAAARLLPTFGGVA